MTFEAKKTMSTRDIIYSKEFLKKLYEEWYAFCLDAKPQIDGKDLEIGSGGGFIKNVDPQIITSEIDYNPLVCLNLDGMRIPLADKTLRSLILINALHHITNPDLFFRESIRCLKNEGRIILIEPWVSTWSSIIYRNFHYEIFDTKANIWRDQNTRIENVSNNALSWILFKKDRYIFEHLFPELKIVSIQPMVPFRYLLSGGMTNPPLTPGWTFTMWTNIEKLFRPIVPFTAMFAGIILKKQ